MPTSAMTALATITLASAQSTVTFSSITGSYRDLRLIVSATNSSASTNLRLQYNGDTATNYSFVVMEGNGSSAISAASGAFAGALVGESYVAESMQVIDILDYSATDKHKTALARNNRPAGATTAIANRWANTAAITTILVFPGSSTFAAGSTFTLYGVSA